LTELGSQEALAGGLIAEGSLGGM